MQILKLKAASKSWEEMVNNAQASNGMFLYLDPRNELKTGVVLDVKLQLKALIVEPRLYIAVNRLTEQQKVSLPISVSKHTHKKLSFGLIDDINRLKLKI